MTPHLACSATSQVRYHYFFSGLASWAAGIIIFFGWHQAWGLDLFFDHGCDFIFRGFRAKGKRSVQLILTKIVCLAGLGCPVSLFFFDRASWAARYHYFFRAGPAGLSGFIIFSGRAGWAGRFHYLFLASREINNGTAKNKNNGTGCPAPDAPRIS